MIRRPPRSTPLYSSAASDVYKRQLLSEGVQTPWINDIVILVICSWTISVLLMVLNLKLTQFIEGYGLLRKTCFLKKQQRKFDELHDEIKNNEEFLDNYDELNKDLSLIHI